MGDGPRLEVGFWLSSEEHGPKELVRQAVQAEEAGFASAMISDHFHPWVRAQGSSPFVWGVLGALGHATERLRIGTGVTAPIIRMHPAVVAHAAATAAVLLDGRFFLGVGTGERLNEHVVGARWPPPGERRSMLEEAVEVIRRLWAGDEVNHRGEHYRVERAQLFTLPDEPPPVFIAASSRKSANLAGRIGDGFVGVVPERRHVEAFEEAGGAGKPRVGQVHLCWASSRDEAVELAARVWPNGALRGGLLTELSRPKDFEQATRLARPEDVAESVVCGPDVEQHAAAVRAFADAGYTAVYVHQVGPDQQGFLRFWERELAPALSDLLE